MHPLWVTFLLSLCGALLLTPLARRLAVRIRAVDRPDGLRKLQARPIPLLGGVAVYAALAGALLVARQLDLAWTQELQRLSTSLLLAGGVVCLFGCIDDVWELNSRFKLLLQVAAVLPVVASGYYLNRVVAFGYPIELGWMGIPITVCWLVGCINALNLLDGLDGLASVVGLSTAAMLAIIAANVGHPHVALIAIALAGALAGFLVYNLPPASIYLGDSGSMVIGLVVGILGMQGALKTSATLSITVPLVVMSIPLWDTVLAIVRRRLTGQAFDAADRGHIHHRLLDRGLSTWQALWIIAALCLTTGGAATAATIFRNDALAWITTLTVLVVLVRTRAFGHFEFALIKLSIAGFAQRTGNWLLARLQYRARRWPQRLASLDFDEAWSLLVDEATRGHAHRLTVELCAPDEPPRRRTWQQPELAADHPLPWSLACGHQTNARITCRVLVASGDEQMLAPWNLLRLIPALEATCAHWAAQPERLPLEAAATDPSAVAGETAPHILSAQPLGRAA